MKRYLLAGAAFAALATSAESRDRSAYFGLEIGPMWAADSEVRVEGVDAFDVNHKIGVDGDLILGYDFGLFRAEVEGSHKWAKHDEYDLAVGADVEGDGHSRAYSLMGNAMLDLGGNDTVNFYVGAGAGMAWIRQTFDSPSDGEDVEDSNLAWQLIAGVRAPVFRYFDVGAKYRYFDGGRIKDSIDGDSVRSRFRSHSVLASLIYNFAAEPTPPPPPPPPLPLPPPPPATRTCPDGSVILATEPCPTPPPPPPPPPPTPERGG